MRRFISISFFALALMIGATGAAPVAHAGLTDATDGCPIGQLRDSNGLMGPNGEPVCVAQADLVAQSAATAASLKAANETPIAGKSSPAEGYNSVMQWIMSIFAWLVGVAALTLDTAVFYTVVTMGDYVHKLTAIGVAWRILRDIGNIMLIFGFLAIGISIILNTERLGWGKKMLPMLLVAAVFLNFSLFFSEAIIDTGNLFATQFYKQINGGNMPTAAFTASATVKNEGISNKLMAQLGLASLYNVNDGKVNTQIFQGSNPSIIGFLGILLFIVTAFVLFSLAFILIARFVVLIFLIILAPVGFAGLAVPQLKHKAGQWWSLLFQQTITAPVLLLLLYVALAVITDAQFLTGFNPTGGTWLGYLNSTDLSGFGGVLLSFLVAMGLLLAVTISAKSLSAFGADKATALAGKLSFGATAFAGRRTFGRAATAAATRFKSSKYARSGTGRLFATGLDKAAGSSFDVRGVSAFGGLKATGVDVGEANKGGYAKIKKDAVEARTKYAKELELTPEENKRAELLESDQKELDKMIKKTNEEISDLNSEIKQAEKEGKETSGLKDRKKIAEALKQTQETRKEAQDKTIIRAKNIAQIQYAEGMQSWSKIGGPDSKVGKVLSVPYSLMVGPAANKDAAKKILKEAKKSKSDKDLDALKKILEDGDKKTDHKEEKKPEAPAAH